MKKGKKNVLIRNTRRNTERKRHASFNRRWSMAWSMGITRAFFCGVNDSIRNTICFPPDQRKSVNSRRTELCSEDELALLIWLTKSFRFFVNTRNIGDSVARPRWKGHPIRAPLLDVNISEDASLRHSKGWIIRRIGAGFRRNFELQWCVGKGGFFRRDSETIVG